MGPVGPGDTPTVGSTQMIDTGNDPALREQILAMLAGQDIEVPDRDDNDVIDQLERLTRLRDTGALTDREFRAQKRKILGND